MRCFSELQSKFLPVSTKTFCHRKAKISTNPYKDFSKILLES